MVRERGELVVTSVRKQQELSLETMQKGKRISKIVQKTREGKKPSCEVKSGTRCENKVTERLNSDPSAKSGRWRINRLLKMGHIKKISEIKDNGFIQPTVTTVKKNRCRKIALSGSALNQALDEDKYRMLDLENLLDMVAEKLETEKCEAWFSLVDMAYAYGQVPRHQLTAKQCNSQFVGSKFTGTYRLLTGLYSLSVRLTEFQKVKDISKS